MMKKHISKSWFLVLALFILSGSSSISAETVTLRWSQPGKKTPYSVKWYGWFAKEVEERTEGRVKVKHFWGQSLCRIKDMPEFVKGGMADVGWVTPAYHPGYGELLNLMPVHDFFVSESPVELMKKWLRFTSQFPANRELFEKQNMIPIAYRYFGPSQIWSKKPIRTLDDFNGIKIRSTGKVQHIALSSVGAVPIMVPATEVFGALQKNILHGLSMSVEIGGFFKAYKLTRHLTLTEVVSGAAVWVMNKDTFDKLTPADQKVVLQVGRELTLIIAGSLEKLRKGAIGKIKKEARGFTISTLPASEKQKWRDLPRMKKYQKEWVRSAENKGIPARAGLKLWQKILAE